MAPTTLFVCHLVYTVILIRTLQLPVNVQKWDPALKVLAEGYAAKCVWNHNPDLEDTGENLFAGTGPMDLREGMEKWFLGECRTRVKSLSRLPFSHAGVCWVNTSTLFLIKMN